MKFLLVVGMVFGLAGSLQAAEREAYTTTLGVGTTVVPNEDSLISASAQFVTGVILNCTGTACSGALYDHDETIDNPTHARLKVELAAAANGTTYLDLSDAPLRFTTGVLAVMDANGRAMVVLTESFNP